MDWKSHLTIMESCMGLTSQHSSRVPSWHGCLVPGLTKDTAHPAPSPCIDNKQLITKQGLALSRKDCTITIVTYRNAITTTPVHCYSCSRQRAAASERAPLPRR